MKHALKREGVYRCAGNFWWLDHLTSPTPGVPLNEARVLELGSTVFASGPKHVGWSFHIAVDSCELDVLGRKGSLFRISPEEAAHALLFTVANAITMSAPDDELKRWRHICLTVPFVFELIPKTEDILWRAHSLRQALTVDYNAMKRTARQAAHDVFLMKQRVEFEMPGASAKQVLEALLVKAAPTSKQEFSENYIQSALTVYETVCCDAGIVFCLTRLENSYSLDSCFNSISKLYDVVKKCDDAESRSWVFEGIVDGIESMTYNNGDISRSFLIGGKHGVGLVQLLQFKRHCLRHFLDVEFPKAGFRHADLQIIREKLSNHSSYRAHVTSLPRQLPPDHRWLGKLAASSHLAMQLLEAVRVSSRLVCCARCVLYDVCCVLCVVRCMVV